jgi:hypothetical protein
MRKREIDTTNDKMALVAAVAAKWPEIGRNAILGFTMDSMRDALRSGSPAALTAPPLKEGGPTCVMKGCAKGRGKGLAVCETHRAAFRKASR